MEKEPLLVEMDLEQFGVDTEDPSVVKVVGLVVVEIESVMGMDKGVSAQQKLVGLEELAQVQYCALDRWEESAQLELVPTHCEWDGGESA